MRKLVMLAALVALAFSTGAADAKTCKDVGGRFTKCPAQAPAKAVKCKDAKGKFTKCDAAATSTPAPEHKSLLSGLMKPKTPASPGPSSPMASSPVASTAGHHPNCKKGKACGNSCIAMADVCHK
jgi:hypothetical protein